MPKETKEEIGKRLEYHRRYYQENKERISKRHKRYRAENKKFYKDYYDEWGKNNKNKKRKYRRKMVSKYPERFKARNKINNAVNRQGRKVEKVCYFCNSKDRLEKHHPDYNKPLSVIVFCKSCHLKLTDLESQLKREIDQLKKEIEDFFKEFENSDLFRDHLVNCDWYNEMKIKFKTQNR